MAGYEQLIATLIDQGFFRGILPFIISYVLFFFVLKNLPLPIFSGGDDDQKTFAAVLSLAFAFYTSKFVLENALYQKFFFQYMPRISMVILGVLGLLATLAFLGIKLKTGNGESNMLGGIFGLIVLGIFMVSGGLNAILPGRTQFGFVNMFSDTIRVLAESGALWLIVIGGVLYLTARDSDKDEGNKWYNNIPPMFGPWQANKNEDEG